MLHSVRCTLKIKANKSTIMFAQLLLLPEDPNSVLICVATGTGIAPFRSFWRRCFYEDVPGWKFTGLFWLFMGAANGDAKLYDEELTEISNTCASHALTVSLQLHCLHTPPLL